MKRTLALLMSSIIMVVCCMLVISTGIAASEPNVPNPFKHPEAYAHPEPYTESELALLADVHAHMNELNTLYDLHLYIPDTEIVKQNDAERAKMALDIFAQEIIDSRAEAERLDELFEAGDFSSFDQRSDDFSPARASNQWEKTADNNSNISMTIYYDIYTDSSPARFKSVNSCYSKGINGYSFDCVAYFSTSYSNNRRAVTVAQKGDLLHYVLGFPVWDWNFEARAYYSYVA